MYKSYVSKYIRDENHKYYKIITQTKLKRVRKEIRKTRKYLAVTQREARDLVTFYKLNCGHYNCSFDSYFQFCSDKILRSFSSNKLRLNLVKTQLFKVTFLNRIPYFWNNLPDNLRTEDLSLSYFKKHCRHFYKSKVRGFDPDRPNVTWV